MNFKIGSKGQVTMADLLFSVMIFIGVVAITSIAWENTMAHVGIEEEVDDIQLKTYLVSSLLTESQGVPNQWDLDYTTVRLASIGESQNVISPLKWGNLTEFSYDELRDHLGVSEFEVYIKLVELDGTLIGDRGLEPDDPRIAAVIMSYIIYEGEISKLYVTLWD